MTISHVGFRVGTVAGSPTLEVRIETPAADGTPSGTLWATNTNVVSGTLTSNSNPLVALTAAASITKGQTFIVKFLFASGTSIILQRLANVSSSLFNTPYEITNTTGSAVKARPVGKKIITLGSSSTVYYPVKFLVPGVTTITAGAFNNASAAKRGLRFRLPFRCRCLGMITYDAAAVGDYSIAIYSDAGSELGSSDTAFDGDHSANSTGGVRWLYFDNPVTLEAGTWYRALIIPSTTTNANVSFITLVSSGYVHGHPGGADQHYTTFAGTWDDSGTDRLPLMDILIDQIDLGGAGSPAQLINSAGLIG